MAKRKKRHTPPELSWDAAFQTLKSVVSGGSRQAIVRKALESGDLREGLRELRSAMRRHRFRAGKPLPELKPIIQKLDAPTCREGVHVLQAWHHDRHEFLEEIMPILLLDHCAATGIAPDFSKAALAILLDYYLLQLLTLLALRAWDEGEPNSKLDRASGLLRELQGPGGSGFRFVDNAETLILLSISQYHPEESAYTRLLRKIQSLDSLHQLEIAKVMAAMLGGHLRWGYWDLYNQDLPRLRKDNVIDYPWLLFSVLTLLRSYEEVQQGAPAAPMMQEVAGCLLNGLSADPECLLGKYQDSLFDSPKEHREFRNLVERHQDRLLQEFHDQRPSEREYSPLSLRFNFPHNVLVAMVICSLQQGVVLECSLNDLLVGVSRGTKAFDSAPFLGRALTAFSLRPERLDTRGAAQVVYDPADGLRSFEDCIRFMEDLAS